MVKNPLTNAGDVRDVGSIPGSGRSPGGGHGNPLQYSLPGEPHGQRSLVGYSPQGRKELDMTEVTQRARTHTHTLSSNMPAFPVLSFHIYVKLVILPELLVEVNTLHRSRYICQSDIFCTQTLFSVSARKYFCSLTASQIAVSSQLPPSKGKQTGSEATTTAHS